MVRLDHKSYLSPPGSQPSSQPPSQPSSSSSHSDHAHYSIVEDYSGSERTRPDQFVPPRQPPALSSFEGPKQFVSPASTVISAPPPRSSSYSRLDQLPGQQSLSQAGMQAMGSAGSPGRQPIKNPPLHINTARAQRSMSPTYQNQRRSTSPLGPGVPLPGSTSSSSLHAFSSATPVPSYPPMSPSGPVHAAHMISRGPSSIATPVRAVAPPSRVNPMVGASPPAIPPAAPAQPPSFGQVADDAGPATPAGPASSTGHASSGPASPAVGLAVSGPAIPAMLAQAPARSTSLDPRAGPATPISPMIQTPSGAMQFPFSALSPNPSPKQTFSPLPSESHEMEEYFDALSVDQIIRDAPQVQNVEPQYAPDVQGLTASVHGYISPLPSPSPERPERLPYLSGLSASSERLPYLSPEGGSPTRHSQQ